jgi:hypothetical protein
VLTTNTDFVTPSSSSSSSSFFFFKTQGRGIAIYVGGHEGRGIGLVNKIRAYSVQDEAKLDTFAANESLGLPRDGRSYEIACAILEDLEIENVNLLTNNKFKVEYLREQGFLVRVTGLPGRKTEFNQDYLAIKKIEQESKETSGAHSHAHVHAHAHAHSHSEEVVKAEEEAEKKQKPGHAKEIPIALPIPSNLNKIRIGVIKTAWNSGLVDSLGKEPLFSSPLFLFLFLFFFLQLSYIVPSFRSESNQGPIGFCRYQFFQHFRDGCSWFL